MTDKYQRIRDALAMGPTPGPWADGPLYSVVTQDYCAGKNPVIALVELIPAKLDECMANKSLICACDPDTIRALLEELDALRTESESLLEEIWRLLDSRDREGDRLDWLLARLPGDVIRDLVGEMSCTSDVGEWRDRIDKAARFKPLNALLSEREGGDQ